MIVRFTVRTSDGGSHTSDPIERADIAPEDRPEFEADTLDAAMSSPLMHFPVGGRLKMFNRDHIIWAQVMFQ